MSIKFALVSDIVSNISHKDNLTDIGGFILIDTLLKSTGRFNLKFSVQFKTCTKLVQIKIWSILSIVIYLNVCMLMAKVSVSGAKFQKFFKRTLKRSSERIPGVNLLSKDISVTLTIL